MGKRMSSFGVCLLFVIAYLFSAAGIAWVSASAVSQLDESAVIVTDDLSEYENGEVLVGYSDGSVEVLTYEDETALADALETLPQTEGVVLVQPNYT